MGGASVAGSHMLLKIVLAFPDCDSLGAVGYTALGNPGKIWGNMIQLSYFFLFLPVAMQFTACALRDLMPIAVLQGCQDYYIFMIAAPCLLLTQARTLDNTLFFAI